MDNKGNLRMKKLLDNMRIKILMQKKRLNQALEQNRFLEEDLNKILEEE